MVVIIRLILWAVSENLLRIFSSLKDWFRLIPHTEWWWQECHFGFTGNLYSLKIWREPKTFGDLHDTLDLRGIYTHWKSEENQKLLGTYTILWIYEESILIENLKRTKNVWEPAAIVGCCWHKSVLWNCFSFKLVGYQKPPNFIFCQIVGLVFQAWHGMERRSYMIKILVFKKKCSCLHKTFVSTNATYLLKRNLFFKLLIIFFKTSQNRKSSVATNLAAKSH